MLESQSTIAALAAFGLGGFFLLGLFVMVTRWYRKVTQGKALIINNLSVEPHVTFTGGIVLPVIHRAEEMDISIKTIEIDRRGADGLICKDNIRADIKVTFFVRVNQNVDDVRQVAQSIGCARASDETVLENLFSAKFSEALKTVGKRFDFGELYEKRQEFRREVFGVIGDDLNGYILDDAAIDYLEQTPITHLDEHNILDAEGIRKITQLTAVQHVQTNEFRQSERKAITKQNVEAEEAVLELQRQEAEARAQQRRKIETDQAQQEAETKKAQAAALLESEQARIAAEREIAKEEENKQREVEVAQWNRQRVVAVEAERAEKEKSLEAIGREREVELQRIAKEKELEKEKKEIADVIRARVSVDKTVAEEEERIKDLRTTADAKRKKDVVTIAAEAKAQEHLVMQVKTAEAEEHVAKARARVKLVEAEASLEASDKEAQAKIRLADGVKAETAASGLAEVQVREANAVAIEKEGMAKARVTLETMQSEAAGLEKKGLADVKVQEEQAKVIEKKGMAEASALREKMVAEASGEEARASAIEKQGVAEATATREKAIAEAKGIEEKATAMKALDGVSKEHEEFRLQLEKEKEVELAALQIREAIAGAQAEILQKAFETAKINIVGGDGQFFDKFINAVSLGQATDGFFDNSESARTFAGDYLDGQRSLPADLKEVLSRPALGASDLQNLSVSAVLVNMLANAKDTDKGKLQELLDHAKSLGLDRPAS